MNDAPRVRIIIIESQSESIAAEVIRELTSERGPGLHVDKVEKMDFYSVSGQAGAVGPNAKSKGDIFMQFGMESDTDLAMLAEQLRLVRSAMKDRLTGGSTAEQDEQVGQVAKAEIAAAKGDKAGVMAHLREAGTWAVVVAREAGAEIVAKLIAHLIGFTG
jgi:hypothetical protein